MYEGKCRRSKDNSFLGKFKLSGIPSYRVVFLKSSLSASTIDKATDRPNRITITKNKDRPSKEEISGFFDEVEGCT